MNKKKAEEILNTPMAENDAGAKTIREFFVICARKLWWEEESFAGKKPFGNSGWTHAIDAALVRAGLVKGSLDEDGYVIACADTSKLVYDALKYL